jgi:hypothetical protein
MNAEQKTVYAGGNYCRIGELPEGTWTVYAMDDGRIVLACPEHELRIIDDGRLAILTPLAPN